MSKLTTEQLLEAVSEMTVLELSEFVKAFEEKFGVSAAAPVAVAAAPAAGGAAAGGEAAAGGDSVSAVLSDVGANKIQVKQAIEKLLGAKVASIRTAIAHGKMKRQGRYFGRRSDWKKAYVTLRDGQKMPEFLEGA